MRIFIKLIPEEVNKQKKYHEFVFDCEGKIGIKQLPEDALILNNGDIEVKNLTFVDAFNCIYRLNKNKNIFTWHLGIVDPEE